MDLFCSVQCGLGTDGGGGASGSHYCDGTSLYGESRLFQRADHAAAVGIVTGKAPVFIYYCNPDGACQAGGGGEFITEREDLIFVGAWSD